MKRIFYGTQKVLHFAPEQAFINCSATRKPRLYHHRSVFAARRCQSRYLRFAFDDNTYDIILCNHVLEHIPDDTKAMQELYRVLKPGGMGIFQIPQDFVARRYVLRRFDYRRQAACRNLRAI
jgi:2-polyprenyl-3-methyl-5-hydroxy-6-metoxy-1,4-benzoquinol methylase